MGKLAMTQLPVIGWVKGPGQSPHEFTFISPDTHNELKTGEFIIYYAPGVAAPILCRLTSRNLTRLYPDAFAHNPTIPPTDVTHFLGYTAEDSERFEFTATIVGYYDAPIDSFSNPRLPPRAGEPVYLADKGTLTGVLSRKQQGEIGSAYIGTLLSRTDEDIPITLDASRFTSTHLSIIASTGAGKSYLAGILAEELMMPYNRGAILIIDPHREYHTLSQLTEHPALQTSEYQPKVHLFDHLQVKIHPGMLTVDDLVYLLPDLSERMQYLLNKAFFEVRQASFDRHHNANFWTRAALRDRLSELGGLSDPEGKPSRRDAATAEALLWRLDSVIGRSSIFDEGQHHPLNQLLNPGQLSILQTDGLDKKSQIVLVASLLRRIFHARRQTETGKITSGPDYLPYPVFILIEEAHQFAPAHDTIVTSQILKQILSEGRKFGVAVGLISQRPGKLDSDILSQCNTHFLLRIVNHLDQQKVMESVETVGRSLVMELANLTPGQIIVAGQAIHTPVLVQGRKRLTPHGGAHPNAPQSWVSYQKKQRKV